MQLYVIICAMSFSSGDFFDTAVAFGACSGSMCRMKPEVTARENERQRKEAEEINSHPLRFLLRFILAVSFLIFSIWLVCRNWEKSIAIPPSWHAS